MSWIKEEVPLAVVASNYDYPIMRIDTNQDVYGIGEVRDAGHKEDALRFKSFLGIYKLTSHERN